MTTKSWITTSFGLLALIGTGIAQFWPEHSKLGLFLAQFATGAGLLFARDNKRTDEEVGAGKSSDTGKLVSVIGLGGVVLGLSGCMTTGKTLATTAQTVDAAMQGWAEYVAIGAAKPADETRVRAAYEKYQASMNAAVAIYKATTEPTAPNAARLNAASALVRRHRAELIALINQLIPPKP